MSITLKLLLLNVAYLVNCDVLNIKCNMENPDMETLYMPSCWSKRYNATDILQKHLAYINEESEKVRKTVPSKLDVPYGPSDRQKFDVFGTDLPEDAPIFIYIHGGYWQLLDKASYNYIAQPFYNKQIKTIFIEYDLAPNVTLSQIMDQVRLAMDKILSYAPKARSIVISGHSAGAHLAASLFMGYISKLPIEQQNKIKAVYLISGIYDVVPVVQTTANEPLKLNEETAKAASPMLQELSAKNEDIKFKVLVAQHESPAFIKQSNEFNKKLLEEGFKSGYIFVLGKDHFDIVEGMIKDDYSITKNIIDDLL